MKKQVVETRRTEAKLSHFPRSYPPGSRCQPRKIPIKGLDTEATVSYNNKRLRERLRHFRGQDRAMCSRPSLGGRETREWGVLSPAIWRLHIDWVVPSLRVKRMKDSNEEW
jgi:hypothetical protein